MGPALVRHSGDRAGGSGIAQQALMPRGTPPLPVVPGLTVGAALRATALDPVDARVLLMHALQMTRVQLVTQADRPLSDDEAQRLSALFLRRLAGEPVAYIIGRREFYGLSLEVTPDVLIPRPETELLVDLALERLPQQGRVLDLGTGSGAIPVAIAHVRPDAQVAALDVSAAALAVARRNAARYGVALECIESSWYQALDRRQFELIVSNPPYIVAGDAHLSQGDLRFEPVDALTDHADGLDALRAIIAGAPARLVSGGWLLMEHGYDQAAAVRDLLATHGFSEICSWRDLAGIERVTGGRRVPAPPAWTL
jgi:release factor glutamine methyltransferase